ncbi:MAG: PepSY domain-containing protein [Acidobacteria bacterium]|nr:PepSY domain-containing protein [Acidobacteriota bacterium]
MHTPGAHGVRPWWTRWLIQPQSLRARRWLFQVHAWTGVAAALYVVLLSLSGSVLVYRNELYRAFEPRPVIVRDAGVPLPLPAIEQAARTAYPGYAVREARPGASAGHGVEVTLVRDGQELRRVFHPATAADLGDPVPLGYRATTWLIDLHDNLLAGDTGRTVNGLGALLWLVLAATGAVVWWPGRAAWRRSLRPTLATNWKGITWRLHSALGVWSLVFIAMWGLTGTYLAFPDTWASALDWLEPYDAAQPGARLVDQVQYWLAFLHFGRLGGRGIPGCGPGACNEATKAIWALVGLAPTVLALSGTTLWWNRRRRQRARRGRRTRWS